MHSGEVKSGRNYPHEPLRRINHTGCDADVLNKRLRGSSLSEGEKEGQRRCVQHFLPLEAESPTQRGEIQLCAFSTWFGRIFDHVIPGCRRGRLAESKCVASCG